MADHVYGSVTIRYLDDQEDATPMYTLTERTYVNADRSRVVSEDSPEAAFLLGPAGVNIPVDEARRLGLVVEEKALVVEEKALPGPPEDKALKPADNKAAPSAAIAAKKGG